MKKPIQVFSISVNQINEDTVDINIDGVIVDASTEAIYKAWFGDDTSVSFKSFRQQVERSEAKNFNVYINSPGGQVIDAMAIHDLLVDMQAKGKTVNTIGRGLIASAATYILMAGNKPQMTANSWLMIHNVSGGVYGDVNEIENYAGTLRKFNNASRDYYAGKTNIRKEEVTKMMDKETWMTAEEAKDKGFISEIQNAANFTNLIDREQWNFTNLTVLNSYNGNVKTTAPESSNTKIEDTMKNLFLTFTERISNLIKGVPTQTAEGKPVEPAALLNSISEAITQPFQELGEQMEAELQPTIDAAVTTQLGAAIDAKVLELTNRIKQLEDDQAAAAGGATRDNTQHPEAIGKWNKG